jgi:TonB-linked SusC/RagA family outer membrane protein
MNTFRRLAVALLTVLTPFALSAQGTRGIINGRVTEAGSNAPIGDVQVTLVGTTIGAITRSDGSYSLRGVPQGTSVVRALRIGYAAERRTVTVRAGETLVANFSLAKAAVTLAPVVTTATGTRDRGDVPNQIVSIDASKVIEEAPIQTVGDLLVSKAAGVSLIGGSSVGSGQRVRIRGTASLSLSNEPIYIIDGVRMSGTTQQAFGTGGAPAGRLNDINPDDIENLEVLKGPAASATYGTDAATGVIVITTKRGRNGAPRWNFYTEQGNTQDRNAYPLAYTMWGRNAAGAQIDCNIQSIAGGTCRPDSLTSFNVWKDPRSSPLKDGYRYSYGANISGGSDAIRYYISGEREQSDGTLTVPQFELDRLRRNQVAINPLWTDPNNYGRWGARANVEIRPRASLTIPIQTYFTTSRFQNPQDGNNTNGLGSHAFGGAGTFNRISGTDTLGGYRLFTPGDIFQQTNVQNTYRFIGGAAPTWSPTSWLTTKAAVGLDFTSGTETNRCLRDECPNFGQNRLGFVSISRTRLFQYTGEASATASFQPLSYLQSTTIAGFQYVNNTTDAANATGSQLPPGGLTVTQASVPGSSEGTTIAKTAGYFIEQRVKLWDRLSIEGSIRGDQNSAFGQNFGTVIYPRIGSSFEFPIGERSVVNNFRVRAAWGQAGLRPGTTAALPFFAANAYRSASADAPGIIFQQLGDLNLRPESVTEAEGGFDVGLFNDKVTLALTHYYKLSKDAIFNRVIAPSVGTGNTTQADNLGAVSNRGWEALLTVRPIQQKYLGVDVTVNASFNENALEDLGRDDGGNPIPPIIGTLVRQTTGFPLNGFWQRQYTYADANGDGLIAISEVTPDTAITYVGYSQPTREVSTQLGVDLFNNSVRVSTLFDYRGGYYIDNTTERFRCQTRVNSRERIDPTAPLDRQARCAAAQLPGAVQTFAGYAEPGDFVRLRELAVTYRLPKSVLSRLTGRLNNGTITASGRNLFKWTKFTGVDPETAGGGLGNVQDEFQVTPPLTSFTLRVNFGF